MAHYRQVFIFLINYIALPENSYVIQRVCNLDMTTLKKSQEICLNWIVPNNVINVRQNTYIYKAKIWNNLYFLIFTRITIFFRHWVCNYLLLTRYFNSYTQTKDLLAATTCAALHRESQDYFLLNVKCWNSLCRVLQIKISVNWAAHRLDPSEEKPHKRKSESSSPQPSKAHSP